MNTLIPLEWYYPVYIYICFFFVVSTLLHSYILEGDSLKNINHLQISGYLLLLFLLIYIGQRPISGIHFGDTINYYRAYIAYEHGAMIKENVRDYGWHLFMKFNSQLISVHSFFTICSFLYIYPLYRISIVFFKKYWFYAFLMFVISFSFYTYGVNGVRNGTAGSLFLWGISYYRKKVIMALFFILAIQFHKTLLLPILAFMLTNVYDNPKIYLKGWLACIPLSLIMGSFWIGLFTSLGFGDDRLADYLTGEVDKNSFSSIGFRWDFLFYSSFAVFTGWYFIIKQKFKDKMYSKLFNTYLICNGFWILIINANYSNRFAYLSWFMMAIIIIYPLLKEKFFEKQAIIIGKIIFAYFSFTYLMFLVYAK